MEFVLVNSALVNAQHLRALKDDQLALLARLVEDELSDRADEEDKLPWPDGLGRTNPNAGVVTKRIW